MCVCRLPLFTCINMYNTHKYTCLLTHTHKFINKAMLQSAHMYYACVHTVQIVPHSMLKYTYTHTHTMNYTHIHNVYSYICIHIFTYI